jgi:hypothetical protein
MELHDVDFLTKLFALNIFFAAIPSSPTKPPASSMTVRMKRELKSSSCPVGERRRVTLRGRRERERSRRMNSWTQNREDSMPRYPCSFFHSILCYQQNSRPG